MPVHNSKTNPQSIPPVELRPSRYNPGDIAGTPPPCIYRDESLVLNPDPRSKYVDTPACPACTAPGLTIMQKGELKCGYCGSTFRGIPLICPSCSWINNIEAEDCPECGEPLTVFAQVIHRRDTAGEPQWRRRVQSQLGEMRSAEDRASQIRLQAFQEIDQSREKAVAEQKAQQSKADRTLYTLVAIIGIFVILGFIMVWVVFR